MTQSPDVTGLVLAAGASRRLGQPKQLVVWEGEYLLVRTVRALLTAGCSRVLCVLGANADPILDAVAPEVPGTCAFAEHSNWRAGPGSTLGFGVGEIRSWMGETAGVLVTVSDLPRVDLGDYRRLLDSFRSADNPRAVAAAEFAQTLGVPACFGDAWFDELQTLEPEQGAKPLLMRHLDDVLRVPMDGALHDVDLPSDL